jgi:predicted metal-binding membrane protein
MAIRQFIRRHPEWWSLAVSAGAWIWILRGDGCHVHARGYAMRLGSWVVMTLAMMLPMVVEPLRAVAADSRRPHGRIALFLAAYLGCWTSIGAAASLVDVSVWPYAPAAALLLAGAWQVAKPARCTRPLAPLADPFRHGWQTGARCVVSCWALMLVCLVFGHALPVMVGVTAVGMLERYARVARLSTGPG